MYRASDLRRPGTFVAVKVVPVETDLGDLLKEIEVLKKCHSDYIVGYFGSYMGSGELYVRALPWPVPCDVVPEGASAPGHVGGGVLSTARRVVSPTATHHDSIFRPVVVRSQCC